MNETLKHIFERNSCRDFKDTPLTDEQVDLLVKAALAAPSALNLQPWYIVMVTDKAIVDGMDDEGMEILKSDADQTSYERMMSRGGKLFYNAPSLMLVMSDGSDWGTLDSGILCQNVVIAAQSLGLGTCIVGMARIPLSGPKSDDYKKLLKLPEGCTFAIGILIGTVNTGKEPHELDMGKVTYINP